MLHAEQLSAADLILTCAMTATLLLLSPFFQPLLFRATLMARVYAPTGACRHLTTPDAAPLVSVGQPGRRSETGQKLCRHQKPHAKHHLRGGHPELLRFFTRKVFQ
jgi:hypothetical protein